MDGYNDISTHKKTPPYRRRSERILSAFLIGMLSSMSALVVFWLVCGGVLYFWLGSRRRKLYRFFGIPRSTNRLIIYLSSIYHDYGLFDSEGNDLTQELLKQGRKRIIEATVPDGEFQLVSSITSLFRPRLSEVVPDILGGLADYYWLLGPLDIEFLASPEDQSDLKFAPSICLGSANFNTATAHYLKACKPFLTYIVDNSEEDLGHLEVQGTSLHGQRIPHRPGEDVAMLVRTHDPERGNTVFIAAGTGMNGTRTAANYLIANWRALQRQYPDKEFGICFRCPGSSLDIEGYRRFEIVCTLPPRDGQTLGLSNVRVNEPAPRFGSEVQRTIDRDKDQHAAGQ